MSGSADNEYPYGDSYEELTCNGRDYQDSAGTLTTVAVESMQDCQSTVSGYEGVFDLSGNVSEWEDACDERTGQSDQRLVRGGLFLTSTLKCGLAGTTARDAVTTYIGFRCCSP